MPELPEVETVRRLLESTVVGRRVAAVSTSGAKLREPVSRTLGRRLRGRAISGVRRVGKYLLLDFEGDLTLLAHLGMTGCFLFHGVPPRERGEHVHARLRFEDGAELWFQDARRFGLLLLYPAARLAGSPQLAVVGPDPLADPPTRDGLYRLTRSSTVAAKSFLMDQRRVAGLGNIYASEVLHRARVHPAARACDLDAEDCAAIACEIRVVLDEAIRHCGTTISDFATPWGEAGDYGSYLKVYDRAGEPCPTCGTPIERMVQGQRSTFFCPTCQPRRRKGSRRSRRPKGNRRPRRVQDAQLGTPARAGRAAAGRARRRRA
jgi:formamidopyrimidine-DNA glycosylase